MWADACEMIERAERLHRQFFRLAGERTATPLWEPPVDIFETEDEIGIIIALPGVDPNAIEVTIEGDLLTVAGFRQLPLPKGAAVIHRIEIPHGQFQRTMNLGQGRGSLRRQHYSHGCLMLAFAKSRLGAG
jgi:HSP20 family molecular chaperone IbpA